MNMQRTRVCGRLRGLAAALTVLVAAGITDESRAEMREESALWQQLAKLVPGLVQSNINK